jgi:hypothetical protein
MKKKNLHLEELILQGLNFPFTASIIADVPWSIPL